MKSIALALIVTAVLAAPVFTQDVPEPSQVAQARTPQPAQPQSERQPAEERERTMPPPPPAAPPAPSERRALPTRNVKVDVTITDQTGSAAPVKKVVSVILADGRPGGVRSMTSVPLVSFGPNRDLPLHVDATATVTGEQKVLLDLRFNYASVSMLPPVGVGTGPEATTDAEKARDRDVSAPRAAFGNITENLSVLLTPNVPIVVSRSADAAIDRTVTVEVKAEILR